VAESYRAPACADQRFQLDAAVALRPSPQGLSPMNELAMNLATGRVDDRYFKVFIIAQALVEKMLCKLFAMMDRFGVGFEVDSDPVPERNSIFHIEKEFLHLPHLKLLQRWN
jgi:hypothetical protein